MNTDNFQLLNPAHVVAAQVQPFCEQDFAYCLALSQALLQDPQCRNYPDLIALGFWLRPAQLRPMLAPYMTQQHYQLLPLGLIYHSSPANVDSLFVYTGILSLLCGNRNQIRISNRSGASTQFLLDKIIALADSFPLQNARFQLFRCAHDSVTLKNLQQQLDARVLWGSDASIQQQRATAIPAHARDLSFSHKFSLCLLDAKAVLNCTAQEFEQLLQLFSRDHLTFAQQGCASAKALFWYGDVTESQQAQQKFWPALEALTTTQQKLTATEHYQALCAAQQMMMQQITPSPRFNGSWLPRLSLPALTPELENLHPGCGLFLEMTVQDITRLPTQLRPQHQTLSYWGIDLATIALLRQQSVIGLDRITPLGQTLNFSPVWDGVDLVHQFSRLRAL